MTASFLYRTGILALLLLTFTFCQSTRDQLSKAVPAPPVNQEITTMEGTPILVGKLTREAFAQPPYQSWFEAEYQAYQVDAATLDALKNDLASAEILVFLGTWCSDSQRELPRFYKITDYLGIPEAQLQVIGLDSHPDRYKQSPQGEEAGWNIEYVPTFIVLRNVREIGRIVEAPWESLEKDLAGMLEQTKIFN